MVRHPTPADPASEEVACNTPSKPVSASKVSTFDENSAKETDIQEALFPENLKLSHLGDKSFDIPFDLERGRHVDKETGITLGFYGHFNDDDTHGHFGCALHIPHIRAANPWILFFGDVLYLATSVIQGIDKKTYFSEFGAFIFYSVLWRSDGTFALRFLSLRRSVLEKDLGQQTLFIPTTYTCTISLQDLQDAILRQSFADGLDVPAYVKGFCFEGQNDIIMGNFHTKSEFSLVREEVKDLVQFVKKVYLFWLPLLFVYSFFLCPSPGKSTNQRGGIPNCPQRSGST